MVDMKAEYKKAYELQEGSKLYDNKRDMEISVSKRSGKWITLQDNEGTESFTIDQIQEGINDNILTVQSF